MPEERTDEQTLAELRKRFVQLVDKLHTPLTEEEATNVMTEIHFCESGIDYFEQKHENNH